MTILLLIRHASNDYLKEGRLAGRTPGVHINAQGQREADDLARRTAHLPIGAV
jgi:probable phosphoglycerate mutase